MLSGVPGFLGLHIGPGDGRKCVLWIASLSIPVEAGGGDVKKMILISIKIMLGRCRNIP